MRRLPSSRVRAILVQRGAAALLRPAGLLVVSELTWLTDTPQREKREFWAHGYPGIQGRKQNRVTIDRIGLELVAEVTLPHVSWFREYLDPLDRRAQVLEKRCAQDGAALEWLAEQRREVEIARRFKRL